VIKEGNQLLLLCFW